MRDLLKINPSVLDNILEGAFGEEPTPEQTASLAGRSDRDLLNCYLDWNGIVGYTDQIIIALDSIRASGTPERKAKLQLCFSAVEACAWLDSHDVELISVCYTPAHKTAIWYKEKSA